MLRTNNKEEESKYHIWSLFNQRELQGDELLHQEHQLTTLLASRLSLFPEFLLLGEKNKKEKRCKWNF